MHTLNTQQTKHFHTWLNDNEWRQDQTINSRHTVWYFKKQPKTTHLNVPKQPRADQIAALAITVYKVIEAYENDKHAARHYLQHNNQQAS